MCYKWFAAPLAFSLDFHILVAFNFVYSVSTRLTISHSVSHCAFYSGSAHSHSVSHRVQDVAMMSARSSLICSAVELWYKKMLKIGSLSELTGIDTKIKVAGFQRLYSKWLWLLMAVYKPLFADAENINWFVIYWYLVCFSLLFIWRGTNWGQNLYKNNTKKRKHNFLELNNSQNRMLTKRKRKNSLHSYHNLIPSSINSNPDSRCIECRLLEKRNYRFSLVSCIFKKVLNQTLYNFIMTDIG